MIMINTLTLPGLIVYNVTLRLYGLVVMIFGLPLHGDSPPHFIHQTVPLLSEGGPDPEPGDHFEEEECEDDPVLEVVAAPGRGDVVWIIGGWVGKAAARGRRGGLVGRGGRAEEEGVEQDDHGEEGAEWCCLTKAKVSFLVKVPRWKIGRRRERAYLVNPNSRACQLPQAWRERRGPPDRQRLIRQREVPARGSGLQTL